MQTLIIGGTGNIGRSLVPELLARGETGLRVLTRSSEKAAQVAPGVVGVVADLCDPTTFDGVFEGTERLFLLNPVSLTELHEGLSALAEAKRVGVQRLVYLSVHHPDAGAHIPHFAAKLAIERAIRESGIPFTFLQPNNFFQNDYWLQAAIMQYGVYPQPIGARGLSRVDTRDVALAAANALTSSAFEGRAIPIVGPEALTGEDCAAAWSASLGRPIVYAGHDLAAWELQARQMMPAWMAYDLRHMFSVFHAGTLAGDASELEGTRAILGTEPRRFDAFTREVAAQWRETSSH